MVSEHGSSALVTLGSQHQTVADPDQDIRGRMVIDRDGSDIGKVAELLIDTRDRKVRFLQVEHGGIFGLGAKSSFLPVDAISRITDDTVFIEASGEQVAAAPAYDPEIGDDYYGNLSGYYGYQPYWGVGYLYPGYPYDGGLPPSGGS
jgi:sporulation protein YlmC with PRC-barrel domain